MASNPRRLAVAATALVGMAASVVVVTGAQATADPSAKDWKRLRICESSNNYRINTGNDHYGAYQFDLATWRSVGGKGFPNQASKAEQDKRALILYRMRGWQPWQCAGIVGLHEDADAGSGRTADITSTKHTHRSAHKKSTHKESHKAKVTEKSSRTAKAPELRKPKTQKPKTRTSKNTTHRPAKVHRDSSKRTPRIPTFPGGSHWYHYGQTNSHIKTFQDQMHKRGYFPVGTGEYGPNTLRMVKQLQRLNGLVPNGLIGPNTWRLAWTGRYSSSPTVSTPDIPAFPGGSDWYYYGQTNSHIKTFQDQMHKRGYFPVGTGEFGPNTLRMVKQLQRLNGLKPNGYLGPNTWRLAWVGRYSPPS